MSKISLKAAHAGQKGLEKSGTDLTLESSHGFFFAPFLMN